jgi:hypothetical protein
LVMRGSQGFLKPLNVSFRGFGGSAPRALGLVSGRMNLMGMCPAIAFS